MKTGVLLLNFGEPETADLDEVIPFLEAIFLANFRLEHAMDPEAGRRRARQLAERRAPALIEDYERMGPSPLRRQTDMQVRALRVELKQRGIDAAVVAGMQFTSPTIGEAIERLRGEGTQKVVALPLYPLCGPSTTIFALDAARRVRDEAGWDVDMAEVSGWHRHSTYTSLRARAVRIFCESRSVDLRDPATRLVFSAHGTPLRYLKEGNRYDLYVRDNSAALAKAVGSEDYVLGYQNHENRPGVAWTEPEIGEAIRRVTGRRVVVVPISFMHEQSETLVELDMDLRERADEAGLEFHRVPIPHDDPAFVEMLAELVEGALSLELRACRCRPGAYCLNQDLES